MPPLTTRRDYDKAIALSYLDFSNHEANCYHYLNDRQHDLDSKIAEYYKQMMTSDEKLKACRPKYRDAVINVALIELTYPAHPTHKYTWSGSQRSALASISQPTWSRHHLDNFVNFIIDDIRSNTYNASLAIDESLRS